MKMMEELKVRGVKVADLAAQIQESYGNTYTALKMDRDDAEVRHKSVKQRLEKIREFLGSEQRQSQRLAAQVTSKKDERLDARQRRRVPPYDHVGVFDLDVGGVSVQPGSTVIISRYYATDFLDAGVYTFLRATAKPDGTIVNVDLYGGSGKGKTRYAAHRTLLPEAIGFPTHVELNK
jgi:hypothetical protein